MFLGESLMWYKEIRFSDVVHNIQDSSSRPLNMREIKEEAKDIIYMDEINHECTLACPPGPPQTCTLYVSKSHMGPENISNRKKNQNSCFSQVVGFDVRILNM